MEILDISNLSLENIKLLNSISNNIKRDFNALTEELLNSTDKSIDWLVNSTTSRNPYWSNISLNICYLVIIKQLLRENKAIEKITVSNVELKKVLIDYLKRNKINIKVVSSQSLKKNIKNEKNLNNILKEFKKNHPLGRIGEPEKIAKAIYFLADNNESSFITGQSLIVDGGAMAQLSTEVL